MGFFDFVKDVASDAKYAMSEKISEVKEMGVSGVVEKIGEKTTEIYNNQVENTKRSYRAKCNEMERKVNRYEATHSGPEAEAKVREARNKIAETRERINS